MIKLRLTPYASTTWTWDGRRYVTTDGTSEIAPFDQPMVAR
ncbi:hypothetical protein ACFQ2B_03395 [Streptomyces stramineus]|uniref:Uncharacterized protein n=1 Tax=Streptomyces stramineus TaxID=173861 RepID=A0ABN1ALW5_9ACTN